MEQHRLAAWIIVTIVVCAALGAWAGHQIGDGGAGNIVLVSATCAVLGSFLPGAIRWLRRQLRDRSRTPAA
ncbi:MAG: hypothetical protein ACLQFR_32335 [Streptosporangiaceae bacterium]